MPYNQDDNEDEEQTTGASLDKKTTEANQEQGGQVSALPAQTTSSDATDTSNKAFGGTDNQTPKVLSGETASAFGSDISQAGSNNQGPSKSASSGSFTNLQSYLDANADNNPASQIASKVGQQGQEAQQGLVKAQEAFQTGLKGQTQYNPDLINQAIQNPAGLTDQQSNDVIAQRHAKYSGTQGLDQSQGYNPDEANKVQSEVEATKTEPGQFSLLQSLIQNPNRPTYSQGEQKLDQLLLQGQPSQQAFSNLQNQYGQLGSQYQQAEKTAEQQAVDAAAQAQLSSNSANTQLNTGYNNLQQMLQDQYGRAQGQAQALGKDVPYELGQANLQGLSDEQIQQIGLGGTVGRSYGLNPDDAKYFTNNTPTLSSVATPDQLAKAQAFSKLLERPDIASQYNPDQVGTFKTPISFNADQYAKDLAAAKAGAEGQSRSWNAQVPGGHTGTYQEMMDRINNLQNTTAGGATSQWAPYYDDLRNQTTSQYNQLLDQLGIVKRR